MASHHMPSVRVVVIEEEGVFNAQCLEYDIGGQGASVEEAIESFKRVYRGNLAIARRFGHDPFVNLPPAPHEYWEVWKKQRAAGCTPTFISRAELCAGDARVVGASGDEVESSGVELLCA